MLLLNSLNQIANLPEETTRGESAVNVNHKQLINLRVRLNAKAFPGERHRITLSLLNQPIYVR